MGCAQTEERRKRAQGSKACESRTGLPPRRPPQPAPAMPIRQGWRTLRPSWQRGPRRGSRPAPASPYPARAIAAAPASRARAKNRQARQGQPSPRPGVEKGQPVAKLRDQKQRKAHHQRFVALGQKGDVGGERKHDAVEHQGAAWIAGHPTQDREQQHRGDGLADAKTICRRATAPATAPTTAAA